MIRRFFSIAIVGYLVLLTLSPLFAWHVHHACLEGAHGFETHANQTPHDHQHGDECQSESLFHHTFEQGSVLTDSMDALSVEYFAFTEFPALTYFVAIVFFPPQFQEAGSQLKFDPDVGITSYFSTSISLRAPPEIIS